MTITMSMRLQFWFGVVLLLSLPAVAQEVSPSACGARTSAILLQPDGMGANTWQALRMLEVGPDGRLAWDRLPLVAVYVGPMLDSISATSNGGATSHAYGVRAASDSYGSLDGKGPPLAASGKRLSIAREAQKAGKQLALVNSSSVTEPATGAFIASVASRDDDSEIASQLLAARPDVLLGGGEQFFLPRGVQGRHGPGVREDGRDLIAEAREAGYAVVFTREELSALPVTATRVLGLFAAEETFNEGSEETLRAQGLPVFQPRAPRFDEMVAVALDRLESSPTGFLLIGNEEATDNLSGKNNAPATLDAAAGVDRAIARSLQTARANACLTVIVASDSDNGGMNATSDELDELPRPLPKRTANGSPLDSNNGEPFLTAPDALGRRLPFYITWASPDDMAGGMVARGVGPGAVLITGTIDSTDIYRALHLALFGTRIE